MLFIFKFQINQFIQVDNLCSAVGISSLVHHPFAVPGKNPSSTSTDQSRESSEVAAAAAAHNDVDHKPSMVAIKGSLGGGEVLVDSKANVVFVHWCQSPDDRPSVDELLSILPMPNDVTEVARGSEARICCIF